MTTPLTVWWRAALATLLVTFVPALAAAQAGSPRSSTVPSATAETAVRGTVDTITRTQARTTIDLLSSRIQSLSRDIARGGRGRTAGVPDTGLSAGSDPRNGGLWFDTAGSHIRTSKATGSRCSAAWTTSSSTRSSSA